MSQYESQYDGRHATRKVEVGLHVYLLTMHGVTYDLLIVTGREGMSNIWDQIYTKLDSNSKTSLAAKYHTPSISLYIVMCVRAWIYYPKL